MTQGILRVDTTRTIACRSVKREKFARRQSCLGPSRRSGDARRERLFAAVHFTAINDCPFSPDGRSIALATMSGMKLRDAESGRTRFETDPLSFVMDVEYSADGRRLTAATLCGGVRIDGSGSGLELKFAALGVTAG